MTGEQATVSQVMWVLGPEFSLLEEQEVLLASQLSLQLSKKYLMHIIHKAITKRCD